jgi:hypothetical protein
VVKKIKGEIEEESFRDLPRNRHKVVRSNNRKS